MTTSHSEPLPDGQRQELIPALSPEVQERDPGLVELVRGLVSADLRLTELPVPTSADEQKEYSLAEERLEGLNLELLRYAEEMAVSKKVDRYTAMLAYLEMQRDTLAREARRLTARKRTAQVIIDRLLGAAHYALNMLPQPRHGLRELEGNNSSLVLVKNPGRVVVTNHEAVPPVWREATVKMNLQLWFDLFNSLPAGYLDRIRGQFTMVDEVMLSALAPALKTGDIIPGVEWRQDQRVERR